MGESGWGCLSGVWLYELLVGGCVYQKRSVSLLDAFPAALARGQCSGGSWTKSDILFVWWCHRRCHHRCHHSRFNNKSVYDKALFWNDRQGGSPHAECSKSQDFRSSHRFLVTRGTFTGKQVFLINIGILSSLLEGISMKIKFWIRIMIVHPKYSLRQVIIHVNRHSSLNISNIPCNQGIYLTFS